MPIAEIAILMKENLTNNNINRRTREKTLRIATATINRIINKTNDIISLFVSGGTFARLVVYRSVNHTEDLSFLDSQLKGTNDVVAADKTQTTTPPETTTNMKKILIRTDECRKHGGVN